MVLGSDASRVDNAGGSNVGGSLAITTTGGSNSDGVRLRTTWRLMSENPLLPEITHRSSDEYAHKRSRRILHALYVQRSLKRFDLKEIRIRFAFQIEFTCDPHPFRAIDMEMPPSSCWPPFLAPTTV